MGLCVSLDRGKFGILVSCLFVRKVKGQYFEVFLREWAITRLFL